MRDSGKGGGYTEGVAAMERGHRGSDTMRTITVTRRTRTIGYAVSTTPTRTGTDIVQPTRPQIVGTIGQIVAAVEKHDRSCGATGGVFAARAWFVNGDRVVADDITDLRSLVDWPDDMRPNSVSVELA